MKQALHTREALPDDAGYSAGIVAEGRRLVFVSGQGPSDLAADPETQIRQAFQKIAAVLAEAGGSMKDVVILRSYFVHFGRDLPAYRKVRREFLTPPFPASTAVGVTELAPAGNTLEIEAVAVLS
jgi:enamine deaminase RidA (YjgF/YER057c/UK114 family)